MKKSELCDSAITAELSGPALLGRGMHRYERYQVVLDGSTIERDVVRVGRIAVILPVDINRDEVILIRQFRLGAHLALGKGDLVELPAGHVEPGEDVAEAARRECEEETGVKTDKLVPIFTVMPSAGMSDELMYFFLAAVDASEVPERAGAAHEHEDTRPVAVPIDQALEAMAAGRLHYGAGIMGLQWLALNRARLAGIMQDAQSRQAAGVP